MKFHHLSLVAALILSVSSSCGSDPVQLQPDTNELYNREFITRFGVPAEGHNYAMATSAGLKVTTAKGGHISVTAEVDGQEYLFADLTVSAGTHAIPVTIPRSVKTLRVNTAMGTHEVATDATVNIDRAPAGKDSRSSIITIDGDNTSLVSFSEGGDAPYIVLPTSALTEYFTEFFANEGKDRTDFTRTPESVTVWGEKITFYKYEGETGFRPGNSWTNQYYLFPLYWRKTKNGNSDYNTKLFYYPQTSTSVLPDGNYMDLSFADAGDFEFANIGLSSSSINLKTFDFSDLSSFDFKNDANANSAFTLEELQNASTFISRGIKVKFNKNNTSYSFPTIGFALTSDNGSSFSSSVPFFNSGKWGGNNYDSELGNLMYSYVSTKRHEITDSYEFAMKDKEAIVVLSGDGDYGAFGRFGDGTKISDEAFYKKSKYRTYILGFNSQPTEVNSDEARDYGDVMFLLIPFKSSEHYVYQYTTPFKYYEWTIAAEDLGGTYDWDFNDAVFSFTDVIQNLNTVNKYSVFTLINGPQTAQAVRCITVKPLAAGGTMPIYITYTGNGVCTMPDMPSEGEEMYSVANQRIIDHIAEKSKDGTFIIGCELHKWLGASTHAQALNVGASRNATGESISFVIPTSDPIDYIIENANTTSGDNTGINGFAVLVDKNNTLASTITEKGIHQMSDLSLGEGTYLISKPAKDNNFDAPQMILVDSKWEWPQERVSIDQAYPDFNRWLSNPENTDWIKNIIDGKTTRK